MTRLSRPVARLVETKHWGEIVVTLTQAGAYFREKGKRKSYGPVSYGHMFLDAVKQELPCRKSK